MRLLVGAFISSVLTILGAQVHAVEPHYTLLEYEDLPGWAEDDHSIALRVFLETCPDLDDPEWSKVCAVATQQPNPSGFFEAFCQPVLIEDGTPPLFTGYFEPELSGALSPTDRFAYPLYRLPPEARDGQFVSRREIEESGVLSGRGLEIAWVDDPVDAFFLHIQGSGRVILPNGERVRLGYAGKNGHGYRSVGQELVRRGHFSPHEVSADTIRNWVRRNPSAGLDLLRRNPSYVFFREVNEVPPNRSPLGAMNRSVTALRSIATDPAFVPLGAPVWIDKGGREPMQRLMIAQDTGSAIKGAQRADIFFGTGSIAGRAAGRIKDPGRMVVLLSRQLAFALLPEERQ